MFSLSPPARNPKLLRFTPSPIIGLLFVSYLEDHLTERQNINLLRQVRNGTVVDFRCIKSSSQKIKTGISWRCIGGTLKVQPGMDYYSAFVLSLKPTNLWQRRSAAELSFQKHSGRSSRRQKKPSAQDLSPAYMYLKRGRTGMTELTL